MPYIPQDACKVAWYHCIVCMVQGFTKSGGPMHWIRMHFACDYCGHRPDSEGFLQENYDKCCPGRPEGLACIPDNATRC